MKTIVPEYYFNFHCIAGKCRNNCCKAGWEIEIDDSTAIKYRELSAAKKEDIYETLRQYIFFPTVKQRKEGARPHIIMKDDGTCPFLDTEGLCRLILTCGENGICQICKDHPRFRNYYKGWVELGTGMCCEEAARLILSSGGDIRYFDLDTKEEAVPFHRRGGFADEIRRCNGAELNFKEWISFLKEQEQLEADWTGLLSTLSENTDSKTDTSCYEGTEAKAVLEYLMYRHYGESGAPFVSFCWRLIMELYQKSSASLEKICRLFSTEIEYSDVNRSQLIRRLKKQGYGKSRKDGKTYGTFISF